MKTPRVWVPSSEEARAFSTCTDAIAYCVNEGMADVVLCLSFGDPMYDVYLDCFRAETRALVEENRKLREEQQELLARLDSAAAETKERKKQIPFRRKRMASGKEE